LFIYFFPEDVVTNIMASAGKRNISRATNDFIFLLKLQQLIKIWKEEVAFFCMKFSTGSVK